MYPITILRSEVVCLVILIFLYFISKSYEINKQSKTFERLLYFAIIHLVFDFTTVLTVNNTATVPSWLNWICHIIFYLSAIFFSNEIVNYVVAICYPRHAKKLYALGHASTLLYIMCLPFLRVDYLPDLGTYSSSGPAAYVGYGLAFLFFVIALVVIFMHWNKMPTTIKTALIPMMVVLMFTEIAQIIWRSVLFTGGAITIVTVGFFFSLENPVVVFKKKAMTDALTGVRSRNSFEEDIDNFDKSFAEKPNEDYTFVFCDLDGLRNVNNRFGHAEGDNYITLISSAINSSMKHATAIYRIGGDEFLILYYQNKEETVEKEIRALHEYCRKASEKLNYSASVSVGYAKSSDSYKSLKDVVKSADFSMYQNKVRKLSANGKANDSFGTKLNLSGLTDKIFDAFCASNDMSYPYITNMETNVTRISPAWKEFFGLDNEFYYDFTSVWRDRIHPDFLEGYMDDVVAVINGHKKYHNYEYFAKKADGSYVRVSCHGSTFLDAVSGITYFAGSMDNLGAVGDVDPVTGLRNYDALIEEVSVLMDESKPFSALKLAINNYHRVNMLYGYKEGTEIVKTIAKILTREIGKRGEVFCQESSNFTVLFYTDDEKIVEEYYKKVSFILSSGIETEYGSVPMLISGGAITNNGIRREIERMRGSLVFALDESRYTQRNNLVFYHESKDADANIDVNLLSEIHNDALKQMKYFQLRYQPIFDSNENVVGAEALLRWIHPKYGEVLPSKFISFLENDPCFYRLGLAIIENAIIDSKRFKKKIPSFRINVNITALQLQNDSFADDISIIMTKHGWEPDGLVLEITERCKEMEGVFLAQRISELRNRGIHVAFDDLGTGYSSISLLMDIPIDEIKLDKDFVKDIKNRENYRLFVQSLALGRSTAENKYIICFEGIEDKETLTLVSSFGNNLAQGYYFSKPLLKDEFSDYIEKKTKCV